ncbi:hypothetical protein HN51_018231 [Arachis hypogaea]
MAGCAVQTPAAHPPARASYVAGRSQFTPPRFPPNYFSVQAVLWHTDTLKQKAVLEEHSSMSTDVRFSPSMPRLATTSFDKTARIWDIDNAS